MDKSHPDRASLPHWHAAQHIRSAAPDELATALVASRQRTLQLAQAYHAHLGDAMQVPQRPELNPPLWELGHVGWFQDWWLARNRQRHRGHLAEPGHIRQPSRRADADALYDSGRIAHHRRWMLSLPDRARTLEELQTGLAETLRLLRDAGDSDTALYFYRLVLLHEDMHSEAAIYMAQSLGIPIPEHLLTRVPRTPVATQLRFAPGLWTLGSTGVGFAFDNELGAHTVALGDTTIDSHPVSWARYLAFVEDGGYARQDSWSDAGWNWRQAVAADHPAVLRKRDGHWEQQRYGRWQPCALRSDAVHLSWFEAQAWCHWAKRRLPSEAEWERAAAGHCGFYWGSVWEWTDSTFAPYPGFAPHPYVDYSAPWFGGRKVLRGASEATEPRIRHPRYRNFFDASRFDIHSGFRSCAL